MTLSIARCLNVAAIGAVLAVASALAQEFPPNVVDPNKAIGNPVYSDPVFWWRMTSLPKDVYEPDPYFYWPSAVVKGSPGDFVQPAPSGGRSVSTNVLNSMAEWAEAHATYALIVVHDGKLQLERYWQGISPDALTNGRALTRSVTPMVLGFAVADGALDLEDPIGKHIDAWRNDPRGQVKVRQLAQNASGLEVARQMELTQIHGNKDLCLAYCGDVVRAAMDYSKTSEPGTRFEVAQENMQLLALVIERATGQTIQHILSERVWKKIGAQDATFQLDRPDGTARVMCCMRAVPRDWARLGMLLLGGGRWGKEQVLPAGWTDVMATPSPTNPNFGTGLWLGSPYVAMRTYFEGQPGVVPQSEPFLADDVRIMEGGGFRTIFIVPSARLMIMRLGQQHAEWDNAYLVNTFLRGIGIDQ
ncbi:MAG: serine hydrolase [Rhodospirillaceae bacterium]|nr:serine hydrolase [Rhodospirillaceae bacterium]